MLSVTISGTVRDSGQVVRVTIQMREACCDGPVDTLSLVPAVDVPFSATYSVTDGTSYLAEITAYDRSGNKADTTLQVRSDRSPPTIYVIAPVFAPLDSEFVNVDGIDTGGGALTLAYSADGGPEQLVDTLVGIPSPYPIVPRRYFYATAVRVPIGSQPRAWYSDSETRPATVPRERSESVAHRRSRGSLQERAIGARSR